MANWIEIRAKEERQRRQDLAIFEHAALEFMKNLYRELSAGVAEYKKHFPDDVILIEHGKEMIEVRRHSEKGSGNNAVLVVKTYIDPVSKVLVYIPWTCRG